MQNVPKLLQQLHNIKNIIHTTSSPSLIYTLQKLIEDAEEKMMVMIMGEFKAGKTTFLNALLGEELLISDVTPATAINTIIKYGDTYQLYAVFKNGTKEILDHRHLKLISTEGDPVGAHLRKKIDYLVVEAPKEILKTITLIDSPGLNAANQTHTYETERFISRADDVIWLFRYGIVGRLTEERSIALINKERIVPLGIINAIDLHYEQSDDELDDYLQEERHKHKHHLRNLIGVSSMDALEAMIESDKEKWEWSNFDELHAILDGIANDSVKKENRILMKSKGFFEELLTETVNLLEKDNYDEQVQALKQFVEKNQHELFKQKVNTVNNINKQEQEMKQWDLFSEKVTSLSTLQDTLKKQQLARNNSSLVDMITALNYTILSFKNKSKDFVDYSLYVKDLHNDAVGSGMTRVKQLFAKKQRLAKVNRVLSLLENKRAECLELEQQMKQQQAQVQDTLKKTIPQIQREINNQRTELFKQAKEHKENIFELIEEEHESQKQALAFLEKYSYIDELQRLIKKQVIPNLECLEKVDGIYLDVIEEIRATLDHLLQIKTARGVIDTYHHNRIELQQNNIHMSFSPELPYNVSDQVPLHICSEYTPVVQEMPTFNTTYLRPYTLMTLTGLLLFMLYQNNLHPKVFLMTDRVIGWMSDVKNDVVSKLMDEESNYIGTAEVKVEHLNIRSGPSIEAEKVGMAVLGDQFDVLEKDEGWFKVSEGQWISGEPDYTSFVPSSNVNAQGDRYDETLTLNAYTDDDITSFITNFAYENFQNHFQLDRTSYFANLDVYHTFLTYSNSEAGCYYENGAEDFGVVELEPLKRVSEREAVYLVEEQFYDSVSGWASKVLYSIEYTVTITENGELVISKFSQESKGVYGFDWCNSPQ
ncbi:dynamin family protein [Metabacillus iocasae]|uniref:SH3b domain-containing protein n=1 Tax=Priestia iocasae TaxID=2291674 RepID=A0ABS2QSE2_9BACI|nr:dynamin family protein [Metabacillus iocasae]MBM7702347.1 hypothetical protein [Metabacillus iocasae]